MSEQDKDKKFKFITEEIVRKKGSKLRGIVAKVAAIILSGILFSIIAAITFIFVEPRLYERYRANNRPHISFPNIDDDENEDKTTKDPERPEDLNDPDCDETDEPPLTIVENTIDADIKDLINIYSDIQNVAEESKKSLVKISSTIKSKDIFYNPINITEDTPGLIVAQTEEEIYILVSYDRVEKANSIKVALPNDEFVNGVIHDFEKDFNLAIIEIKSSHISEKQLRLIEKANLGESYSMKVGDPIIALGSPNGYFGSMEIGFVTSKGSIIELVDNQLDLFNTNIKDNKNGDGIIINVRGEVIGIITNTLKENLNKDLSTIIGISRIKSTIEAMVNKTPRAYLGIRASDMDQEALEGYGIKNGIYINEVEAKSPAFEAGLKSGDIIVEIENQTVVSLNNFNTIISKLKVGKGIEVKIKRTSVSTEKDIAIKVVIEEKK